MVGCVGHSDAQEVFTQLHIHTHTHTVNIIYTYVCLYMQIFVNILALCMCVCESTQCKNTGRVDAKMLTVYLYLSIYKIYFIFMGMCVYVSHLFLWTHVHA